MLVKNNKYNSFHVNYNYLHQSNEIRLNRDINNSRYLNNLYNIVLYRFKNEKIQLVIIVSMLRNETLKIVLKKCQEEDSSKLGAIEFFDLSRPDRVLLCIRMIQNGISITERTLRSRQQFTGFVHL